MPIGNHTSTSASFYITLPSTISYHLQRLAAKFVSTFVPLSSTQGRDVWASPSGQVLTALRVLCLGALPETHSNQSSMGQPKICSTDSRPSTVVLSLSNFTSALDGTTNTMTTRTDTTIWGTTIGGTLDTWKSTLPWLLLTTPHTQLNWVVDWRGWGAAAARMLHIRSSGDGVPRGTVESDRKMESLAFNPKCMKKFNGC
jgi:hypothetical protein